MHQTLVCCFYTSLWAVLCTSMRSWNSNSTKENLNPCRRFRSPDPEGSCRKEAEKTLDPAGEYTGTSLEYSIRTISGFFRCVPTTFLRFPPGTDRNHRKKIPKISGQNTPTMFWFIPAGTVPYSLTRESIPKFNRGYPFFIYIRISVVHLRLQLYSNSN